MAPAPEHICCDKMPVKRGAWSGKEDMRLISYIANSEPSRFGFWSRISQKSGLQRCGKSCRLRWYNYLKPGLKRGNWSDEEAEVLVNLQKLHGNRWSLISKSLPGRTDNEVKNFWSSLKMKKRLAQGFHGNATYSQNPIPPQNPNFLIPNPNFPILTDPPSPRFFNGISELFPQPLQEINPNPQQPQIQHGGSGNDLVAVNPPVDPLLEELLMSSSGENPPPPPAYPADWVLPWAFD